MGNDSDRAELLHCLQLAFAEAFPEQTSWSHLAQTVDRYFHPVSSPVWWIEPCRYANGGSEVQETTAPLPIAEQALDIEPELPAAYVWVCQGIGQATGCPVAYVLALWVSPQYRRQGLGSAAIEAVKEWGTGVGCDAIELQVFGRNQIAHTFYRSHGFEVMGTWLQRPLRSLNEDGAQ